MPTDSSPLHPQPSRRRDYPRPPTLRLSRAPSVPFALAQSTTRIEQEVQTGTLWSVAARRGRRRTIREDKFYAHELAARTHTGQPISLFAVFDGHGGERASTYASERLPTLLLDRLIEGQSITQAAITTFLQVDQDLINLLSFVPSGTNVTPKSPHYPVFNTDDHVQLHPPLAAKKSSGSSFAAVALQVGDTAAAGVTRAHSGDRTSATTLGARAMPPIWRGKSRADGQLAAVPVRTRNCACGTTATVVAFIGGLVSVMHVGDSRAVLARGEECIATRLCEDHRPGRLDELERIEKAGGLVLEIRGSYRVNGVLAVSRAIGDVDLKEWVIAKPDVLTFRLCGEEEFVIVASDGLWDVVSDEESVALVRPYLIRGGGEDADEQQAAVALVESAWDRGALDDVCVVVINLRKYRELLACGVNLDQTDDEDEGEEGGEEGEEQGEEENKEEERVLEAGQSLLTMKRSQDDDGLLDLMTPMSVSEMAPKTQRRPGSKPW